MLAGQAAAYVHHGRRPIVCAAVVLPAVPTWDKHGTEQRQANLAAVNMAGKDKVDPVTPGPCDVVGRVAQAETEEI